MFAKNYNLQYNLNMEKVNFYMSIDEIKDYTKDNLRNFLKKSVVATLICALFILGTSALYFLNNIWAYIFVSVALLMWLGVFSLGYANLALSLESSKKTKTSDVFFGFVYFFKGIALFIAKWIAIIFSLALLIVPGVILFYSYSMAFFILAENPKMKVTQALKESRKLMRKNKFRLFKLQMSYFGWFVLCILSAGIGFLWFLPYYQTSKAKFYDDLKIIF